jgi:isopentenyl diphosphate isomerase/L-lactate dehydrogenase-like FMN-dependent dehydrogenase
LSSQSRDNRDAGDCLAAAQRVRFEQEIVVNVHNAINIEDLRRMAKRRLPRIAFDFVEGGVEDEEGLVHNEAALRRYRMVPRYLVDVSQRDQSVTLFGRTYASPFGIAPTGLSGLFRRNVDLMFAEAAAAANIPYVMSSVTNGSLEQAARIAPNMWFQIYGTNDRAIMHDLIRRARDAGVATLAMTVDVPMIQKRERNIRNGFSRPLKMPASTILEALLHPAWLFEYFRHGGLPMMENWTAYAPAGASADAVADIYGAQTPSADQTWRDLEEIRRLWPGTLLLKGVLHPDDAVRSIELGADGIYVSNHGARQLDRATSPIEMLPAIRAAVGEGVPLVMDSGIRRGSDVLVARCLGAEVAFVGRATMYGAAAGGLAGVQKAIAILRQEVDLTLGALGCTALSALGPHILFDSAIGRFLPSSAGPAATVHEFPKMSA